MKSNDKKIDEDYPGYPHSPSQHKIINPSTREEKIIANVNAKDGQGKNRYETDESKSDGSANAFERTEQITDDE
jgi:hypothetical protein